MKKEELRTHCLKHILDERDRQDDLWGEQFHSLNKWLTILVEEVGEFAKEINEQWDEHTDAHNLKDEIVQVAAVALQIIEVLHRDKVIWCQD